MVILQDAVPGLKRFVSALDFNSQRCAMITRLVVAFMMHRCRMSASQAGLETCSGIRGALCAATGVAAATGAVGGPPAQAFSKASSAAAIRGGRTEFRNDTGEGLLGRGRALVDQPVLGDANPWRGGRGAPCGKIDTLAR